MVHSYHTSSFINPNKANRIYKKRGLFTMIYSIYNETRELSSHGLNVSPKTMNMKYIQIYNVWQPSLVLGRPARALTGPYSLRRLYTGLGTPSLLRHK